MRSHDVLLSELRRSMAALTTEGRVYVRAGRYAESGSSASLSWRTAGAWPTASAGGPARASRTYAAAR
ncbi:hypothetical protein [Streptomyces atroolivaceus]|uniref:hypothetical protein n=1 Tax=Streptomyces atroolivaceus TaxID=66869 RepID=UPI003449602D